VLYHQEHFDGSGYPEGLSGEQIPLASRIIQVAAFYDELTRPRPFDEAMPHQEVITRMEAEAGHRFDPEVVSAFKESNIPHRIPSETELYEQYTAI
jgi:putative two-component system response regulator